MRLKPVEHLENCRPKSKMHTQERQHTRFFVFYNWSTKKTEPNWRFFSKSNQNWNRGFSQNRTETKPNLKNPFHTSLTQADVTRSHLLWIVFQHDGSLHDIAFMYRADVDTSVLHTTAAVQLIRYYYSTGHTGHASQKGDKHPAYTLQCSTAIYLFMS